jgi:hypothetical protein
MNAEKQNEFLLTLVRRLYLELGAHLGFLEWVKLVGKGEDIEEILAQCRFDPAVRPHVDAYMQSLSVELFESDQLDSDRAYREFLELWTSKRMPN